MFIMILSLSWNRAGFSLFSFSQNLYAFLSTHMILIPQTSCNNRYVCIQGNRRYLLTLMLGRLTVYTMLCLPVALNDDILLNKLFDENNGMIYLWSSIPVIVQMSDEINVYLQPLIVVIGFCALFSKNLIMKRSHFTNTCKQAAS